MASNSFPWWPTRNRVSGAARSNFVRYRIGTRTLMLHFYPCRFSLKTANIIERYKPFYISSLSSYRVGLQGALTMEFDADQCGEIL